jgi:hypothetical protein
MTVTNVDQFFKRIDATRAGRILIVLFITFTALDIGVFAVLAFVNQGDIVKNQAEKAGQALGYKISYLTCDKTSYLDHLNQSDIENFRVISVSGDVLAYHPESNDYPVTMAEKRMLVKSASSIILTNRNFAVELEYDTSKVLTINPVENEQGQLIAAVIARVPIPSINEDFTFLLRQFIFSLIIIVVLHGVFLILSNFNLIRPLRHSNTHLYSLNKEMTKGLDTGWQVQKVLLPNEYHIFTHNDMTIEISNTCIPMEKVSGDFLTFEHRQDNKLVFLHADVMGHGVASALITTMTKVAFNNAVQSHIHPASILTEMNNVLAPLTTKCEYYLTAFIGLFDPETEQLEWVNASHPAALVWDHQQNQLELLRPNGPLVGIMRDVTYESKRTKLDVPNRLLSYTDGITEARDSEREMFGEQKLEELYNHNKNESAKQFHTTVLNSVSRFRGDAKPNDDVSFIILDLYKKTHGGNE